MVVGPGRLTPAVKGIVVATAVAYVAQLWIQSTPHGGVWLWHLALTREGLAHGMIWQVLTYLLMHGGVGHLLMNLLGLVMLGPDTERRLGTAHFLALYGVSGVLGGVGYVLIQPGAPCIGASASVFGVMAAFAALFPRQPLALFGIPSLVFDAWKLVLAFVVIEWIYLVTEMAGGVAHSAHLAGAVAGLVYARVVARPGIVPAIAPGLRAWWRGVRPGARDRAAGAAAPGEVDRILDKVASRGFGSLNAAERKVLEQASRERRGR